MNGSIYKVALRSGEGETLVPPEVPFDPLFDCFKLGMRVDPRTNYLFVAGCVGSNSHVFDADNGDLIMEYQLMIQVVELSDDMLSGTLLGTITDPDLDGVASGALFGDSLYVNNARYTTFPEFDTEYLLTKLSIYAVQ